MPVILDTSSTTTIQSLIDKARLQLIDEDGTRWTDDELLSWLADGERAIVGMIPSASAVAVVKPLEIGTRQSLPEGGYQLLSVKRNMDDDEITPGRAVRIASREIMDAFNPAWHEDTTAATVQHYMFDPQDPRSFYVYPPNNGTGKLEIVYSVYPADKTSLDETIEVHDIYQTALLNYILYRAHQKDGDFAAGMAVAMNYLQLFMQSVGATEAGSLTNNPNLELGAFDPSTKGTSK